MSKNKSIFVTALFAVMLIAIVIGLYLLKSKVYMIFVGLLGLYGFLCGASNFCQWLGKESCLLPPMKINVKAAHEDQDDYWQPDPSWSDTYNKIKYSDRLEIERAFNEWAEENGVAKVPNALVAFLEINGLLNTWKTVVWCRARRQKKQAEEGGNGNL